MPELPEVETVRRELDAWLPGREIKRAERVEAPSGPKYAGLRRAAGQRIEGVDRRGKFLLLPLSRGDELVVHLGMTGVISDRDPGEHLRVKLTLSGRSRRHLYFQDVRRFGRFLVVKAGVYDGLPTLASMGPEPLEPAFDAEQLHAGLQRSTAPIKSCLLSQKPVAGLGNIYIDEALWRARIHPRTAAKRVSKNKTTRLHEAIVNVLRASLEAKGTTLNDYRQVDGEEGEFAEQLDAYGRAGLPCRRCKHPLSHATIGQRSTCFCSRCQRKR